MPQAVIAPNQVLDGISAADANQRKHTEGDGWPGAPLQ
jgi:hypothetical protein